MKLTGRLEEPNIRTYYVTGTIEEKIDNKALQKMLQKIENGGMNAFLNDKDLNKFANGMRMSFIKDGYINNNDTLTESGKDIIQTGKAWRSLQGAFLFTVLEYDEKPYLLNAELVKKDAAKDIASEYYDKKTFSKSEEYIGIEGKQFRNIQTDAKWTIWKKPPKDASVEFSFDYEKNECEVTVTCNNKTAKFTTKKTDDFAITKENSAMQILEKMEEKEDLFVFSASDKKSVQIKVSSANDIEGKTWLINFFAQGTFSLPFDDASSFSDAKIEDICLYIKDDETLKILLNEYLFRKAEKSYLGYDEMGHLVNEFQNLFTSPDEKNQACLAITESTKKIYDDLFQCAKSVSEKNPLAYLHLQAFIDLAPEKTITPYIEKEIIKDMGNQKISFLNLTKEIFGEKRNVKSICVLSKYLAGNARNARAFVLFAQSNQRHFGIKTTVITTDETKDLPNKNYQEIDKAWFTKLQECNCVELRIKKLEEIKEIHDRYFLLVRDDDSVEWWKATCELDALRFENDAPRIREDVKIEEEGTEKEITFLKIKQESVPEIARKIMEEK